MSNDSSSLKTTIIGGVIAGIFSTLAALAPMFMNQSADKPGSSHRGHASRSRSESDRSRDDRDRNWNDAERDYRPTSSTRARQLQREEDIIDSDDPFAEIKRTQQSRDGSKSRPAVHDDLAAAPSSSPAKSTKQKSPSAAEPTSTSVPAAAPFAAKPKTTKKPTKPAATAAGSASAPR